MSIKESCLLLLICCLTVSCNPTVDLPEVPEGAQTISLLGDTLYTPVTDSVTLQETNSKLAEAVANYREDPENPENIIWLGRRTALQGQFREGVEIFTEGVVKYPEDPRMYRHRGQRFLTLRMFGRAGDDFEMADRLMGDMEDQAEREAGLNGQNQLVGTLKSNILYLLGLTYYVQENYPDAIETYENALDMDLNNDMRLATLYWYYMALRRNGNDEKAGAAIDEVSPDINGLENEAYLNLLLVFNGVFRAERLIETNEDALQDATLGYGIGNWHYINGREERAFDIWQQVCNTDNWPEFGFIAAEADLSRLLEE